MQNSSSLVPRIITALYWAVYITSFVLDPLFNGMDETYIPAPYEILGIYLCAGVFTLATITMLFHEKLAGMLIMLWHLMVWFFALVIWPDAGMVLLLAFPMLIPAVLFVRNYELKNSKITSVQQEWNISLQWLLANYAAIYLLVILIDMLPRWFEFKLATRVDELSVWSYDSTLGILLLLTAALFFLAAWLSRTHKLVSGIMMIGWYALIMYLTMAFPEFANSGPSNMFGTVILIQGIFYIIFHYKFQKPSSPAPI